MLQKLEKYQKNFNKYKKNLRTYIKQTNKQICTYKIAKNSLA